MKFSKSKIWIVCLLVCATHFSFAREKLAAGTENESPKVFEGLNTLEHLGEKIDLNLRFMDENGTSVALGDFFKSSQPVVLDLAYYACPGLCNYHLNGLGQGLKESGLTPGKDYQWVVVSFDSNEKPELARSKKQNMVAAFAGVNSSGAAAKQAWHFLTGDKAQIDALAKQVGFSYRWVPEEKQFAHASVAYIMTPEGKISRYLKGVQFDPRTIKLSLLEARSGGVSAVVDSLILWCFHWDEDAKKFSLAIMRIARIAGALTALLLLVVIGLNILKNRRSEK